MWESKFSDLVASETLTISAKTSGANPAPTTTPTAAFRKSLRLIVFHVRSSSRRVSLVQIYWRCLLAEIELEGSVL